MSIWALQNDWKSTMFRSMLFVSFKPLVSGWGTAAWKARTFKAVQKVLIHTNSVIDSIKETVGRLKKNTHKCKTPWGGLPTCVVHPDNVTSGYTVCASYHSFTAHLQSINQRVFHPKPHRERALCNSSAPLLQFPFILFPSRSRANISRQKCCPNPRLVKSRPD